MQAELARLNAEAAQISRIGFVGANGTQRLQQLREGVDAVRKAYSAAAVSGNQFLVENRNITAASTRFNDALEKQKLRIRDVYKNMDVMRTAYREQLALSKMTVTAWNRTATGKMGVTMAVPNADEVRLLDTFRTRMGYAAKVTRNMSTEIVNLGKNIQWSGRQLTVGFTVPVTMASAAMGKLAYDMDASMTGIVKVYDKGANGIKMSNEQIRAQALQTSKQMAATYGQSSKDTLDIMQELAAAGKTGNDLTQQTVAITKAKLAGDLDTQTALKTNITLQSAYNLSTKDLAKTWAFFNSIENSTVLTMQDISDAIPRVAGIMNAMGVSIQDTTVLLTAFKAAGIDAVEGATALKSISMKIVAPQKNAREGFKAVTGIDYEDILKETKGEFIPTLTKVAQLMNGLDKQQKTDLLTKLIGIHQASRMAGLVAQLGNIRDTTTQVGRAAQVAQQDSSQWMKTFNGELNTLRSSISNRMKRALNTMLIQLAQIGQTVLKIATPIAEMIGGFLKWFNSLPEGAKKMAIWAALLTAAIGPVVMLSGLFLNMIGTLGKFAATLADNILKFKILNPESKAAALLAEASAKAAATETVKRKSLTEAILAQTAAVEKQLKAYQSLLNTTGISPTNAPVMATPGQRWGGGSGRNNPVIPSSLFSNAGSKKLILPPGFSQTAYVDMDKLSGATKETAKQSYLAQHSMQGFAASAALAVGLLSSNEWVTNMANMAFMVSTIGPGILGLAKKSETLGRVVDAVGARWGAVGRRISVVGGSAMTKLKGGLSSVLSFMTGPWGLGIAAAFGGILLAVHKVNQETEESRKHFRAAANDAKAWAQALHFQYKATPGPIPGGGGSTVNQISQMKKQMDAFKKSNEDAYEELARIAAGSGHSAGERWGAAINEGLKVSLHGGSKKAAMDAVRTALEIMGVHFRTKHEFEANFKLNAHIDFGNIDQVMNRELKDIGDNWNKSLNGYFNDQDGPWETFGRTITGNQDLNSKAKEALRESVKSIYTTMRSMNDKQAKAFFDKFTDETSQKFAGAFKKAKQLGWIDQDSTMRDFQRDLYNGKYIDEQLQTLGLTKQQVMWYKNLVDTTKDVSGVNNGNIRTLQGLEQSWFGVTKATKDGADASKSAAEAQRDEALNTALNTEAKKRYAAMLKKANKAAEMQKQVMTDTQGVVFDHMNDLYQRQLQRQDDARQALEQRRSDALNNRYQKLQDAVDARAERQTTALERRQERANNALDKRQDAIDKRFDARSDALDAKFDAQQRARDRKRDTEDRKFEARWDAMQDRMQARQQARRDAISKMYDDRIANVNKEINAEQNAETVRQKIFEAEKTRVSNLADMFNSNVDFNVAVNTGDLDEAAKIANDMQAKQEQWSMDDVASESQSASDKRIAGYSKEIDKLNAIKDKRLDNLDKIDDAEQKAFEKRRDRAQREIQYAREDEDARIKAAQDGAKKRLEIERDNARDRIDAERDALSRQIDLQKKHIQKSADLQKNALQKSLKREQDKMDKENKAHANMIADERSRREVSLDAELAAIRAHIPKNMAQMRRQVRDIEAVYRKHGIKMNGWEDKWTDVYRDYMVNKTREASRKMRNDIDWKQVGKGLANQMLEGGIDMNVNQLMRFLQTGKIPKQWAYRQKADRSLNNQRGQAKRRDYAGAFHTGGVVGKSAGGRTGYSPNAGLQQSEVDARLLVGEGVLNRRAMARPGMKDLVSLANQGRVSDLIGDGTGITAPAVAGVADMGVGMTLLSGFSAIIQQAASQAAANATVTGGTLSAEQRRNAQVILGVGKGMGATKRDLIVSIMTAMQESGLRNLHYGDRDSLGLFQQRPSAGWGSPKQLTNPRYAAAKFFQSLLSIPDRGGMSLTQEAQAVQRSAFPSAYAKWADLARSVVGSARFSGGGMFGGLHGVDMVAMLQAIAQGGGGMGMGTANGDYRTLWHIIKSHFPEEVLTSGYRPGATVAGFGTPSMHAMGRAIDIVPEKKVWNWLLRNYGGSSYELLSPWGMYRNGKPYHSALTQANHQDHIHWALTYGGKIPGLMEGGRTLNTGLARLHPDETVLTKPLTAKLESGIDRIDSGATYEYNVDITVHGSVNTEADRRQFRSDVKRVLIELEREGGPKRRIGK